MIIFKYCLKQVQLLTFEIKHLSITLSGKFNNTILNLTCPHERFQFYAVKKSINCSQFRIPKFFTGGIDKVVLISTIVARRTFEMMQVVDIGENIILNIPLFQFDEK